MLKDPSRNPDLQVEDLILDIKHSSLCGIEPFNFTVFVKVNMEKYDRPKTKIDPGTTRDAIKQYDGEHTMYTINDLTSKEYTLKIYVRDYYSHWQEKSVGPIHVKVNEPKSLIKRFSIKPSMIIVDFNKNAKINFDLLCDNRVKYVQWVFDKKNKEPIANPIVHGAGAKKQEWNYRKEGIFNGQIEVHENAPNKPPPEIREFQIIVIDPKKL